MDQRPPTGDMWPIQGFCLLFKKRTKTSIKDLTHPADTNWAHTHTHTHTLRESKEDRLKEKEEGKKSTKSSSPPPPSPLYLSQLPGRPAMNNKTRAEEHLLPSSKEEDKEATSRRDPPFDLLILAH